MNDSNRFHDNGDPSFPLPNGDNTNLHNHDDQEIWLSPSGDHVHLAKTSTKGSNTGNNNVLTGTEKLVIQRRYQCIDLDEEASLKLGEYDDDDSMVAPSDPDHSIDQSRKQPSHSKETSSTNSSKQSTFLENKNDPYSDNIRKNINCPTMWTRWILQIQKPIRFVLVETSVFAAQHPVSIVFGIAILATVLVITGFLTNFHIENREDQLWTPQGSLPDQHSRWIKSVFPLGSDPRQYYLMMLLHAQGNNVVSYEGMQLQFNILERIRSVPDYAEFCLKYGTPVCGEEEEPSLNLACQWYGIPTEDSNRDCDIIGVTRFWFSNYTVFKNMVNSDADIQKTLSINVFPGKLANFDISNIVGYPEFDSNETMTFGKSFLTYIEFNRTDFDRSEALERSVTDELRKLQTEIHANSSNSFRLEIMATRSFEDEFVRGVYKDFVLLPVVGFFMTAFTCLVFYKHGDPLNSRVLLGMGATITVLVSIMTGYGLLFIIGVPFTSLSQACIFIIFGIALDDTFIIFGYYVRTDTNKCPVERIRETMEEVGISIFMTTATTALAFGLGCWTTIPAVQWLCIYGLTTIVIDFVWQITFFVALIVLDERRIRHRRRDILICYKVPEPGQDEDDGNAAQNRLASSLKGQEHLSVILMRKYTNVLLIPWVKGLVIVSFAVLLAVCIWSASQLSVKFNFQSVLPSDSYVVDFLKSLNDYTQRQGPAPYIYFRFVDQSDPYVQEQMETYVDAIVNTSYVSTPPFKFWLKDFNDFRSSNSSLQTLPFNEVLRFFLDSPENKDYEEEILLDYSGNIMASRTLIHMDNISMGDFDSHKDALPDLQKLSSKQPLNENTKEWPFFIFENLFFMWEFLLTSQTQLQKSTTIGIVSVTLMSMFFMPHWSGALFVGPLTIVLYVDLLGVLRFANININGVSYVSIVMAIGLLVDYVMHVTLRFQESCKTTRNEKARDVLESTGASVLLGGISTFLGILPLVFASSDILMIFVISFVSVVLLGLLHGLMFLPVVLSILGPNLNKSKLEK